MTHDLTPQNNPGHPYSRMPWSDLTPVQKEQLVLETERQLDTELFVAEYGSWEEPTLLPANPSPLHVEKSPLQIELQLLRYHLNDLQPLFGTSSWKHFEYKFSVLTGGIAVLKKMLLTDPKNQEISALFDLYTGALKNIDK